MTHAQTTHLVFTHTFIQKVNAHVCVHAKCKQSAFTSIYTQIKRKFSSFHYTHYKTKMVWGKVRKYETFIDVERDRSDENNVEWGRALCFRLCVPSNLTIQMRRNSNIFDTYSMLIRSKEITNQFYIFILFRNFFHLGITIPHYNNYLRR